MIPDFQTLMLPFMQHIADGKEHSTTEILNSLAQKFELTEEELNQDLPSGRQKTFYNRVFWAKAHLKAAKLLDDIKRGHFIVTDRGKQVLSDKPTLINIKFLKQFSEYVEALGKAKANEKPNETEAETELNNATPQEILESSYDKIQENLAFEILSKIKSCSPKFFENIVVELLLKMGYGGKIEGAGKSIGRSGDEGIDGVIKEDRLGLDVIYIQAKRWENVVGRPEIQKFVGALAGQGAKKGVFITTSKFTSEAREYQPKNETKIVLIDGEQLAKYMIDFDLAVTTTHTFAIKKIDNDYFEED
jgi:restriction system protein